ncbi:MAG: hypothetical protein EOO23_06010, partial [Comamonadaceae bacterium]
MSARLSGNGPRDGLGAEKRQRLRVAVLLASDLAACLLAWVIAVALSAWAGRFEWSAFVPLSTLGGTVFTLMSLLVLGALAFNGQYVKRSAFWEETRVIWRYALTAALVNFALNFLVQVSYTRTVQVLAWLFIMVNMPIGRLVAREVMIRAGWWKRQALMVGDGDNARHAARTLSAERHMGIELVTSIEHAAPARAVVQAARDHDCEIIVIALDDGAAAQLTQLTATLHERAFEVLVVPALRGLPVEGIQPVHFFSDDLLFLRVQHRLLSFSARLLKRSFDVVASTFLLVALAPLMAWVAWRIWRADGGPVIYTHAR